MKNKYSWVFALLLWPMFSNAQLHFPTLLTNELDVTPIDDSTRNLVVLIHGWNPDGNADAFLQGSEWSNLVTQLKGTSLAGSGWKLAEYHWETDANTGPTFAVLDPAVGYGNATVAAVRAQQHGDNLASILLSQTPNLRRVHFIAHSAGSWAAHTAVTNLLAHNPYCIVEMTLLDPFIPDENFGMNVGLSDSVMSDTALVLNSDRIYRLENYYADDSPSGGWDCSKGQNGPTVSTQERFAWRLGTDTNLMVNWGGPIVNPPEPWHCSFLCSAYYGWHSGPVQFYGDTVQASIPLPPLPAGLGSGCPFVYGQVGWFRSFFSERNLLPQITSHPAAQTVSPGDTVTLSVVSSGIGPFSYQWYKNGAVVLGPTSASYSFTASANPPASYVVRVGNANGYMFSDKAIVSVYASVAPTISSVSPRTLNTLPLPQTQLITITGSGFTSSSRLTLNDGVNPPYTGRVPASWTATQLTYNIAVGPSLATWTVKVVNGASESLTYSFYVVNGTKELTSLSINGPAFINENSSGQFTATAYFSDSSQQTVTSSANWSENSSVTTISSSGLLSAGSVSSDTLVTVSASYTTGGITKSANANVTVVNSASCGSTIQEKILNGNFANNGNNWTLTGSFHANADFTFCNSCPGYAWMANADGTGGNNLNGTLSQTITIPANATSATLGYYYRITTSDSTTIAYDHLILNLVLNGGSTLVGLDDRSNVNANSAYAYRSFDITSYKGQTIGIRFTATTEASGPTVFRVDDVSVIVSAPNPVIPVLFGVGGPINVAEGNTAQFNAIVVNCDGSIQSVTPTWSENSSATTISSSGLLTAGSVSSDTPVTVTATYGSFPSVNRPITVVNSAALFSYLAISGPSLINENSSGQFTATAIFSDGSSQSVSPSWSENSSATTISSGGLLTAGEVTGDTTVTVSASLTIGGVTRNANQDVRIVNIPPPVTLSALSISGPSSVDENSTAPFSATASFSDGSLQVVSPTWSENSAATSISIFGLLSTGEVASDTPMTVSASYTFNAVTRNASRNVTVRDVVQPTTLSATVSGSQILLTWPTNATGYSLQSTTNLGTAAVWGAVSPPPVVVSGQNVVTNSITGQRKFYRLMHP